MEKIYLIKNMRCNLCAQIIEKELREKVNKIYVSLAEEEAIIDFDENKISEKEIIEAIGKLGYEATLLKNIEAEKINAVSKDISKLKFETKEIKKIEKKIEEKEEEIEEKEEQIEKNINELKKILKIKGMHCNSCAQLIENELKDKVDGINVSYSKGKADIKFDSEKISDKEIIDIIKKHGYEAEFDEDNDENEEKKETENVKKPNKTSDKFGWIAVIISSALLVYVLYSTFGSSINISDIKLPEIGENTNFILLFLLGVLTSFHCISMCGGFVVSYTAKNAIDGHKGFMQHFVYGGSKVLSYSIVGGVFGLIGGVFAFSIGLRGWVAIIAGIFMVFYSLGMMGIGFFKRFQFNPKFLTKFASSSGKYKGAYKRPLMTGLLNGLFIACGPLQAMYLYAAGTGSFFSGATSLAAFGLGTLPLMIGFGSFASAISHKTTRKILKISAVIVLILGLIMLNRGLTLTGSQFSYDAIKTKITGGDYSSGGSANVVNGIQEINMDVGASGYSPNSFVLKKGVPVKWNVNVKQLTGCNSELVSNEYKINARLKNGLNTFEFTPTKTGTVTFSCGMGMLRGSFIVTEDGTASNEQVKSATPPAGHTCGGGGGGCGGCGG